MKKARPSPAGPRSRQRARRPRVAEAAPPLAGHQAADGEVSDVDAETVETVEVEIDEDFADDFEIDDGPDALNDGEAIEAGVDTDAEVVEGDVLEGEVVDGEDVVGPAPRVAAARPATDGEDLGNEDLEEEEDEDFALPLSGRRGSIVRQDTLSRYLSEINRYERLSAEQEHALAVRWREGADAAAASQLVAANLGLVVAVAMGFRRAIANVLDLIQEGNIGLMEAVERFDPHKGTRLSTYATWWIRSRIIKYLLDNWRLVRVGTTNARRKLLYNLRAEKERLEAQGIRPTPKMLAQRLGTTAQDVIAVDNALGASDVSLDQPVGEDGSASRGDLFESNDRRSPELAATEEEFRERLHSALTELAEDLSERERSLLYERLLSDEPVTLQAIADREGVTCEAVRQSEKRLIRRIKGHLLERLPESATFEFLSG